MKKLSLFLLLAFFAGVTQIFAKQYCGEVITATDGDATYSLTNPSGNTYRITLIPLDGMTFLGAQNVNLGINQTNGGGIGLGNGVWTITANEAYCEFQTSSESSVPTNFYGNYICLRKSGGKTTRDLVEFNGFAPTNIEWVASCSAGPADDEAPMWNSDPTVTDITFNSAIVNVDASDNVAVTSYGFTGSITGTKTANNGKISLTELQPNTQYNCSIVAKDAKGNTSVAKAISFTTAKKVYNQFPIGHLNNPNFGDINGRALLTIKKVSSSKIGIRLQHNGGSAAVKYIDAIVNGTHHEFGTAVGSAADLEDFVYINGLSLTSFTLNLVWFCNTPNWNWANNGSFTIKEEELYEEQSSLIDPELTITDPSTAAIELAIDATQQIAWTSSNEATPTFTSSNSAAVEVSADGLITAKAIGSATITVEQAATDTYQEATQTITVTVPGDKSKNTECSGWNNDIWASEGGYTYDFSTEGDNVVLKFTAIGNLPTGLVAAPQMCFLRKQGGDGVENGGSVSGKTITFTIAKSILTRDGNPYLFDDNTIHFRTYFVHGGVDQTDVYIYTVGEDCQEHAVEGVSITSTFTEIEVGQSKTMTAAITPANATNKNVTWSITSGSDKATINSSGTLTAGDAEGSVTVQVETEEGGYTATKTITVVAAKPTAPSALPTAPTVPAEQVKAVYSATYSADCGFGEWGGGTAYTQDTYGKKYVNAANGYFGMVDFALNCSQMEKLHLDVWAVTDLTFRVVPIHGGAEQGVTVNIIGQQWNSIDIALNQGDWANVTDWSNVYQIKIDNAANTTFWLNNVYFYTTQTKTTCALSASVKGNEGGTASVSIAEVAKGGTATFTAVAACGYSFVGWWSNTTKVSTEATYTPTNIQEDLSLVAEFAFVGPSEAATVKTYDQMISIYGVGTPITGVTMNPYWGDATQKNMISVAGKQMWKYSTINYFGIDFDGNRQDVSAMKYIHLDIWSNASGEINFSLIWNGGESPVTVQLVGGQWNSINIPLTNWSTENLKTIRQLKFNAKKTEIGDNGIEGATILVQDIFFYAPNEFTLSEEDDNADNLTTFNGKVCSVTIGRTFLADGYNYTLCLPFDMTADQCLDAFGAGYKLYLLGKAYMKSDDMMYLPFNEVHAIEAGKPYVFCPAANVENLTVEGVTINAAAPVVWGEGCATMTGFYSPTEVPSSNYVLSDENWLYRAAGNKVFGLRCYFTFSSDVPANVRARAIFNRSDVVTDLEPIHRFTDSPIKVIENGRFVIIRNNARYNGMGQQVK